MNSNVIPPVRNGFHVKWTTRLEQKSRIWSLIPRGYSIAGEIVDAKNWCFQLRSSRGDGLFLKLYKERNAALVEYRLLRVLNMILGGRDRSPGMCLRVPLVLEYLATDDSVAIVCELIDGTSAKEVLLSANCNPFSLCSKMIASTTQIHYLISAYADDFHPRSPCDREFGPWSDCKVRLDQLLSDEGGLIFSLEEIDRLHEMLAPYFEILFDAASGFPCDYYKDANPANWMIDGGQLDLVAVDFESSRTVPFIVDFINVTEYASTYLTEVEKQDLVRLYNSERAKLEPSWKRIVADFDLAMLIDLFGLYRHQEQMLHRLRDLGEMNRPDFVWHMRAYLCHLDMMRSHFTALRGSASLSQHDKELLNQSFTKILNLYQNNFLQHFQPSR